MVFVHIVLCVTIIICERVVRRERDASAMIGEAVFVARVWRCGAILANHVSDATSAQ